MSIIDKRNLLNDIKYLEHVVLELGCGSNKTISFAIGVDAIDYNCVDIVGDVFDVLAALPNNSIDELYSFHFFEHIEDLNRLLADIARVLKPNGKLEV